MGIRADKPTELNNPNFIPYPSSSSLLHSYDFTPRSVSSRLQSPNKQQQQRFHLVRSVYMHSGDSSAECGESQPTEVKQDVSEMENKEITVVGGIPGRRQRKHNSVTMNERRTRIEEEDEVGIIINGPLGRKYWFQRYHLFSRYDQGIQMDEEGWYSVTPEEIAIRHAKMCRGRTVIDCFAGVGGNAIQFAKLCHHVVAIDIDPQKVALSLHNAKIYGVEDCIDFVIGDFFKLAPSLKGDVVYLSPPWGGPSYKSCESFTLDLLKPKDGYSLFQAAQMITPNIIMFLPRNVDLNQVEQLSWLSSPPLDIQIEKNYVDDYYFKGITAYFGSFAPELTI